MNKKNKLSFAVIGTSVVFASLVASLSGTHQFGAHAETCAHNGVIEHYAANATTIEHWACCECHTAWADSAKTIVVRNGEFDNTRTSGKYQVANYFDVGSYGWEDNTVPTYDATYGIVYNHTLTHSSTQIFYEAYNFEFDFTANPEYKVAIFNNTDQPLQARIICAGWAHGGSDVITVPNGSFEELEFGSSAFTCSCNNPNKFVVRFDKTLETEANGSVAVSRPVVSEAKLHGDVIVHDQTDGNNKLAVTKEISLLYGTVYSFETSIKAQITIKNLAEVDPSTTPDIPVHIYYGLVDESWKSFWNSAWSTNYAVLLHEGWNTVRIPASYWNEGSELYLCDLMPEDEFTPASYKIAIGQELNLAHCTHETTTYYEATPTSVEYYECDLCHKAWADEAKTVVLSDNTLLDTSNIDTDSYYKVSKDDHPTEGWFWSADVYATRFNGAIGFEAKFNGATQGFIETIDTWTTLEAGQSRKVTVKNNTAETVEIKIVSREWTVSGEGYQVAPGVTVDLTIPAELWNTPGGKNLVGYAVRILGNITGSIIVSAPRTVSTPTNDDGGLTFNFFRTSDWAQYPVMKYTTNDNTQVYNVNVGLSFSEGARMNVKGGNIPEGTAVKVKVYLEGTTSGHMNFHTGLWGDVNNNWARYSINPGEWTEMLIPANVWNNGNPDNGSQVEIYDFPAGIYYFQYVGVVAY